MVGGYNKIILQWEFMIRIKIKGKVVDNSQTQIFDMKYIIERQKSYKCKNDCLYGNLINISWNVMQLPQLS